MNIFPSLLQGDSTYWYDEPYSDANGKIYNSNNYALTYVLAGPIATPLVLTAGQNGTGWLTSITPVQSGSLGVGQYWWQAVLTATNERVTIGEGELEILVNLANAGANYDGRSQAEKALSDAEAALSTFQNTGGKIKKYTIGSRHMEFQTIVDLMLIVNYWKMAVDSERAASQIAQGLGNPKKLFVRFTS